MTMRSILWVVLTMPALALGASVEQQELAKALAATPDTLHGARLYHGCQSCHGRDGGGVVVGTVPRIAGQYHDVLVRQIIAFRHGKRWDMRMEGVTKSHGLLAGPQDIADVTAYISSMTRDGARGIGDGTHLERGTALYTTLCQSCHGMNGNGSEDQRIPQIGGQHAAYLARQIYDAVDGRRLPLTRTHRKRFENLSFEEVLGLTDYIARMGWERDPPWRRERFETDDPNPR